MIKVCYMYIRKCCKEIHSFGEQAYNYKSDRKLEGGGENWRGWGGEGDTDTGWGEGEGDGEQDYNGKSPSESRVGRKHGKQNRYSCREYRRCKLIHWSPCFPINKDTG